MLLDRWRLAPGLVVVVAVFILASCGAFSLGDDPTATPEPPTATPTLTPTATPTATPTPTPTPVPLTFEHCYTDPGVAQTRAPASLLDGCQVVAYYGHPGVPAMGVMGEGTQEQMLAKLQGEVAAFAETNDGRPVLAGLHLIAAVAQPIPGADGTHLSRLAHEELDRWVAFAEENDLIILLDLQMGTSTVDAEIDYYREYFENPRVHLALDPEWAMRLEGVAPGTRIGNINASEINRAQEILQEIAEANDLPSKILMVHQFQEQMIRDKENLMDFDRVELVIHMDGFGGPEAKIGGYNRYVGADGAEFGGFKLFYDEDINRLSAAEVNALDPLPVVITFQ